MVQLINSPAPRPCPARLLEPTQRRDLVLPILSGHESISQAAREHDVSRTFVARQTDTARHALDHAFAPPEPNHDVLFTLPVTKAWIEQAALGLLLIGHCSLRGVSEFFRDVLDYPIAHTTVRNIVQKTLERARTQNAAVDLNHVRIGAHDEIYQSGRPVLVGCDVDSTYCYLLSPEQHCDAETWGVRLLELVDAGWDPEATIADFGIGLRAGQRQTLPELPCRGDLFHALKHLGDVAAKLDNRAYHAIDQHRILQEKQRTHLRRRGRQDQSLGVKVRRAAQAEAAAIALADDVRVLLDWLRLDVWPVAGPSHDQRRDLYDFILAELHARMDAAGPILRKVRTTLANHRDDLLAFAKELDRELDEVAAAFEVSPTLARAVLHQIEANPNRPDYWPREADLHRRSHGRLHELRTAIEQVRQRTVRASSVIENLNRRLRPYFFLRRQLGPQYLDVLRYFLNHRRFVRSDRPERTGHSPRELLSGQPHPHWLELLGYQRFKRN
jgi:hypothetical protein